MVGLAELALVFLKVGALGFGGPFALLALIEKEVVSRRGWLTPEEFAQSAAIGSLTPGPIFFAAAVNIGYRLRSLAGAGVAAAASLLPAFAAAVALAVVYFQVKSLPAIGGAAHGLKAAVAGLLFTVALRTGRSLVRDWAGAILAVASFTFLEFFKLNPAWVMIIAGLASLLLYQRPVRANPEPGPHGKSGIRGESREGL